MKKLFLAIAAVASLFTTSCSKEDANQPLVPTADNEFVCVIDQNANPENAPTVNDNKGTLSHIDGNNIIWWQEGDQILYYGNGSLSGIDYYPLTCSKKSDGSALFSASGIQFGQGEHKAYYPSTLKGGAGLELPGQITINPDRNAAHLPMYGYGNGAHYITFHNICAVLRIQIPATFTTCNTIVLRSDDAIHGSFTIQGDGTQPNPYKAVLDSKTGPNTIIVVYAPSETYFPASTDQTPSYVYVPIPEGTYQNFSVRLQNGMIPLNFPTSQSITVSVNTIYPVKITPPPSILLPGSFSVASGKTVQFTNGNLYWDGSALKIESSQDACPTSWDQNHVGHFYFAETAADAAGYGQPLSNNSYLFCDENHPQTIGSESGLYVLTIDEWKFLLGGTDVEASRPNAIHLRRLAFFSVYTGGLLIAPDGYTVDADHPALSDINTPEAATAAGVVYLPLAGSRFQNSIIDNDVPGYEAYGFYWSSTSSSYFLGFNPDIPDQLYRAQTSDNASAIRLVKTVTAQQ